MVVRKLMSGLRTLTRCRRAQNVVRRFSTTAYAMARKFLMDVDTGVDDAQALMMLVAQPDVDLLGVTCCAGNIGLDQVCRNTLTVLKVMGKTEIPVFRGCKTPLLGSSQDASFHHGSNGLGGYEDPEGPPDLANVDGEHAACAIARFANQHPGEVTLVATAPLTNVAMALRLDPDIASKFKKVVVMGGNLQTKGNDFLCAEFNFGSDPEAVYITLSSLECPLTLVTFEACVDQMKLPWSWYDELIKVDTDRARFHKAIDAFSTHRKKEIRKFKNYYSCDPAAVAVALDPSVATDSKAAYCTIELSGSYSRGSLIIDWKEFLGKPANATLVTDLDTEKLQKLFEDMVKAP